MDPVSVVKRFRGDYEFLSNFYPAKILFDGIAYYNAEAAYQAQKCADFAQREQFAKLYSDESKRFGHSIVVREDWDEIKIDVMKQVVRAKFEQNPRLAEMLLATGDIPLQEGNTWHDVFWGVDLKTGAGENHLGRILMQLRENFKTNGVTDRSNLRPIQEHRLGKNLVLTDEAMADVVVACIVVEADDKAGIDMEVGRAALRTTNGLHTIIVKAPVYMKDDEMHLGECYKNSLDIVETNDIKNVAFPMISVGKKCFPKRKSAQIAAKAVTDWVLQHPNTEVTVYLVPEDSRVFDYLLEEMYGLHPDLRN